MHYTQFTVSFLDHLFILSAQFKNGLSIDGGMGS